MPCSFSIGPEVGYSESQMQVVIGDGAPKLVTRSEGRTEDAKVVEHLRNCEEQNRQKKENAIIRYFKETRAELRKVSWPSREEAVNLTVIVIAVTTAMAAFLGAVDFLFSKLFGLIIR